MIQKIIYYSINIGNINSNEKQVLITIFYVFTIYGSHFIKFL